MPSIDVKLLVVCRAKVEGGRRCPACGAYPAAAKANANRRHGREARRKLVEHLRSLGLLETAAAVQAAPPSMLPELMEALNVDPAILGTTPLPSTHSNPPSAAEILAIAEAERIALAEPKITPEEAALIEAREHLAAVNKEVDDLRKAVNRIKVKIRNAKKADDFIEVQELGPKLEATTAAHEEAKLRLLAAEDAVASAEFAMKTTTLSAEELDAYYASMPEDAIDKITAAITQAHLAEATTALHADSSFQLSNTARNTKIYAAGKIPMETGSGVVEVEGRLLDGGTAIYRRGSGDFLVLQRKGDAYYPVGTASGKDAALEKANRIPIFTGQDPLPADATAMQKQAWKVKADLAEAVARNAAAGSTTSLDAQQKLIDTGLASAAAVSAESVGGGPIRAEIHDGAKRHRRAQREKAAAAAGEAARSHALAAGASAADADAAYTTAYRKSLGTPTRFGGVIPHFEHEIPPPSLGATKHKALWRSGIRSFGKETASDYSVIGAKNGDLRAWGFHNHVGALQISDIGSLTSDSQGFLNKSLSAHERAGLRAYTGGSYQEINAAITGRDLSPSLHIKTVVDQIDTAFDKFVNQNPNSKPMTIMRGTKIPSGWTGTPEEYLDAAFVVGSKMQIGKVTSCTTRQQTALNFSGHPPYMMVIRTRDGLPVKSISHHSGEDEIVLPPGTDLRCVKVEHNGIGGTPTVYLVAEDIVAEVEDGVLVAA